MFLSKFFVFTLVIVFSTPDGKMGTKVIPHQFSTASGCHAAKATAFHDTVKFERGRASIGPRTIEYASPHCVGHPYNVQPHGKWLLDQVMKEVKEKSE